MRLPSERKANSKQELVVELPYCRKGVREFHDLIVCHICKGYLIDPTTVDYCYHTYCRSCILTHLLRDAYCPQCKSTGGKQIAEDNLRSDEILRALVYKMVPGLYQRECERLVKFEEQHGYKNDDDEADEQLPERQEFFTPAEPISLSLEYHPAMVRTFESTDVPPVCYLQCPAGFKIQNLKRFLCSKYDIDAENKQVEVEVTYEDEVLPTDFTLMDVGYCYKWNRHAPMAFRYRILLYDSVTAKNDGNNLSKVNQDIELSHAGGRRLATTAAGSNNHLDGNAKRDKSNSAPSPSLLSPATTTHTKSVTFADDVATMLPSTASSKTRSKSAKAAAKDNGLVSVRGKKSTAGKRELDDSAYPLSNFKSLRSNDMRYSDYALTPAKPTPSSTPTAAAAVPQALVKVKCEPGANDQSGIGAAPNILVSIPQSQLSKSARDCDDVFVLKTANKKSPNGAGARNLPKLKIELTSMKAKLTMPKSADARIEELPSDQLDLETYAKNIGLKPIEPMSTVTVAANTEIKYSPSASPMSSCSSSTTSSSNGVFPLLSGAADASTGSVSSNTVTSSHRKRKKKHSKEPKDSNGKRKKMHAEISSQTECKMKMKITTTHNHKTHKMELKRSHSLAGGELSSVALNKLKLEEMDNENDDSMNALNKTLGEESRSINNLINNAEVDAAAAAKTVNSEASKPQINANVNEHTLPSSPPLPPSLFKTFNPSAPVPATPLPANPLPAPIPQPSNAASVTTAPTSNLAVAPLQVRPKCSGEPQRLHAAQQPKAAAAAASPVAIKPLLQANTRKPTPPPPAMPTKPTSLANATTTSMASVKPHFVVPKAPTQRYLSTPTSIASAANKQQKRSLSLDEVHPHAQLAKQPRLDYLQQALVSKCAAASLQHGKMLSTLSPAFTPQLRLYGPDQSQIKPSLPVFSPATVSLAMPTSGSVTITPRQRPCSALTAVNPFHGLAYPYAEVAASLSNMPALEIVRISGNKVGAPKISMPPLSPPSGHLQTAAATNRLMGPPVALPKSKRAAQSPPMPANVRSPPLSVALSGQRGYGGSANVLPHNAYRSSPPALINLRNTVPLALPSKSAATTSATPKTEGNTKKPTGSTMGQSKANGTAAAAALDKSKTSLREFRPTLVAAAPVPVTAATPTSATATTASPTTTQTTSTKDADILDLSAGTGRAANVAKHPQTLATKSAAATLAKPALTATTSLSASAAPTTSVGGNSLEAALNKIKQNISANSNATSNTSAVSTGSSGSAGTGDDLQNLHMLSESATAREKISIKANIFENKPKSTLVRQQNASVRNIPNPSALAFRNQTAVTLPPATSSAASTAATVAVTVATSSSSSSTAASNAKGAQLTSNLSFKSSAAEEKAKVSPTAVLLSPTMSSGSGSAAATSPRALKKPTTIDQVAANLNIRAEAKAAALAEEAPSLQANNTETRKAKSPELATASAGRTSPAAASPTAAATSASASASAAPQPTAKAESTKAAVAAVAEPEASAAAATATAPAAASMGVVPLLPSSIVTSVAEALPKPPVQIAATDTLAPVASSA